MLLTETYKEQNRKLHEAGNYGISGAKWAGAISQICDVLNTRDVLDYGCGKRKLERALGFDIKNYDPCIEGLDARPEPAQIVACTDVLEHIEPECLDSVLDDLRRVTLSVGFFVIANRPAGKTLPDGRNAHLIQEGPRWWLPKLCERFEIRQMNTFPGEFAVVVG